MTLHDKIQRQLSVHEKAIVAALSARFADVPDSDFEVCLIEGRYLWYLVSDQVGAEFLREEFPELRTNFDRIDEARKP